MRRSFSLLVLAMLVTGCSTLYSALPNHSALGSTSGLTVEQYAIGRLGSPLRRTTCPKAAHAAAGHAQKPAKGCPK
jgi:hypothetical protein